MRKTLKTVEKPISTAARTAPAGTASRTKSPRAGSPRTVNQEEKNVAPSQWGRRMARLIGAKFNVQMSENQSKNEGIWRRKDVVIKCAKSPMPPVSVLTDMLERLDQLWAVFVMPEGHAEIWAVEASAVRSHGYFTHGPNVARRVEIYRRKIILIGKQIGTLTPEEVDACNIP